MGFSEQWFQVLESWEISENLPRYNAKAVEYNWLQLKVSIIPKHRYCKK